MIYQRLRFTSHSGRWMGLALVSVLSLLGRAEAASFSVQVNGTGCAANAQVVAVVLGPQGPDPAKSVVTTANGSGLATFSGLSTTDAYQFLAANPGCTPSLRDQSQDPNNTPSPITDGGTKALALTNGATDSTAIFNVKIPAGVFPKLVIGGCNIASNNVQAGYGIATFGGQTGTLTFYNLRPAPGGTYNCNINSPADNRGGGAPITGALIAGGSLTIPQVVDLTQSFAPPPSSEDQNSRNGGNTGFPSLTVALVDHNGDPVPNAQMRLKQDPTGQPFQFYQADQNGVGNFYGLGNNTTTTYYLDVIAAGLDGKMNIVFSTGDWTTTYSTQVALSPLSHPGTISGSVRTNGALFPGVWMNCHPDFTQYPGADAYGGGQSEPGAGDVGAQLPLGQFSFGNLVGGNYDCNVNSPFSQNGTRIGDGPDGIHGNADDLRLTIDALGVFKVYSAADGSLVSSGSPLVVDVPVSPGASGTISGTLTFPDNADLTANPITIMAFEQFVAGSTTPPHGGITVVNGTGSTQDYVLHVPPGYAYGLQIQGITYGAVNIGDSPVADLSNSDTATNLNFTMAKAGSAQVTVIGPDGSRWLPATTAPPGAQPNWYQTNGCGANVSANGRNVQAWGNASVDQTGIANISGLPSGTYQIQFQSNGGGCRVVNSITRNVVIAQGRQTNVTVNVQNGVGVDVETAALPPGVTIRSSNGGGGDDDTEKLQGLVIGYPRGTPLALSALQAIDNGFNDPGIAAALELSSFTNTNSLQEVGWLPDEGNGGNQGAPKILPGDLTFYLFGAHSGSAEYYTVLGKTNAVVDDAHAGVMSTVFGSSAVPVHIDSTFGTAAVSGLINGTHLITRDDFIAAGGNSDNIFIHIPICAVYDTNNALQGFASAIPPAITTAQKHAVDATFATNDVEGFVALINSFQFGYTVGLLQPGTYTLACTTPNYPPVVNTVTLTAGNTTIQNIDFDRAAAGGTLSGTVKDSNGNALSGASVAIRTKSLTKTQIADSNGRYSFPNLADGIYRLEAVSSGFASATDKSIIVNGAPETVDFALVTAPGLITGKVYASVFPNKVTAGGAKIYAYDDTVNSVRLGPDAPHWITTTDQTGVYTLPNPTPGDLIKIFATTDGKYPSGTQATATSGSVSANDIILAAIPPTPSLQYKPRNGTTVDLTIHVPKVLAFAPTLKCIAGTTYTDAGATDFSSSIIAAPDNVYEAVGVTMPANLSICRLNTDDGIKQQNTDTAINLTTVKEESNNAIRDEAFGGSIEGNSDSLGASIDFPMGSVVTGTGTLPTVQMVRNTAITTGLTAGANTIMSDSFDLQTDANLQLDNGKSLDVTLPVGGNTIVDPHTLRLAQIINGVITPVNSGGFYDPLTGRFTVSINSLGNAPAASSIRFASSSPGLKGLAPLVGRSYAFSRARAAAQGGSFVLVGIPAPASTLTTPYPGRTLEIFNFPNPFNLKPKTLNVSGGGAIQTDGTVIHYDLPAENGGHVIIRIFSVSGDLVRVIDEGNKTGGNTYYTTWDGKNMNGAHVASGVYFGVFDVPGLKAKQHVVKLAVLK